MPLEVWFGTIPGEHAMDDNAPVERGAATVDPTYRIEHLRAAHQPVVSVPPDAEISVAITEMWAKDFSQLAVTNGPRHVKGVISWKTIARTMAVDKTVST